MTQDGCINEQQVKMVIVGDGGCGKTSLLMVYAKGDFPEVSTCKQTLIYNFTLHSLNALACQLLKALSCLCKM